MEAGKGGVRGGKDIGDEEASERESGVVGDGGGDDSPTIPPSKP